MTMSMAALATLIYGFMWWFLAQKNRYRLEGKEDARIANMSDEEVEELGDLSPRFLYST